MKPAAYICLSLWANTPYAVLDVGQLMCFPNMVKIASLSVAFDLGNELSFQTL